jgi:hypothetical protein
LFFTFNTDKLCEPFERKIVRTKQTQRRRVFNPLIPRESIFISEPPPEVIEHYQRMLRKNQKERES